MEKVYSFKTFFSHQIDENFKRDFCLVCNAAFGKGAMTEELFERKFLQNIYGSSVLCVCYDEEGTPAGARALWRNDVDGHIAYQPCDTCVLKEHRRHGLFEQMTAAAVALAGENVLIYNYPNDNSRHLYLKLGWSIFAEFKPRIWNGYANYQKEHPEAMSADYYNWWIQNREGECFYREVGGKFFWVKNYGKWFQMIAAEISKDAIKSMKKAPSRPLVYWSSEKKRYNINRESFIVLFKNCVDIKIPTWKMDVI